VNESSEVPTPLYGRLTNVATNSVLRKSKGSKLPTPKFPSYHQHNSEKIIPSHVVCKTNFNTILCLYKFPNGLLTRYLLSKMFFGSCFLHQSILNLDLIMTQYRDTVCNASPCSTARKHYQRSLTLCSSVISPSIFRSDPFHHGLARPQVTDGADGLQIGRVAANIQNKKSWTPNKG
jgi:hypothetical protein